MGIGLNVNRTVLVVLVCLVNATGWAQEKLPEFFGVYALDEGRTVSLYEGQGSGATNSKEIEWYSIPQNSKLIDSRPQLSTSARFLIFYSNAGEMIQAMSLYKLPLVRNILESLPADAFHPPTKRVVSSPNLALLAGIPQGAHRLLAKPVPNQLQMVEIVPAPKLSLGLYVLQYSPSGGSGWFSIFSITGSQQPGDSYCLDLTLPGGPRGLFERANSELAAVVPVLPQYRYTQCDAAPVPSSAVAGSSTPVNGGASENPSQATTWNDLNTGLTWMSADNGVDVSWQGAVDYCKNLKTDGGAPWRLPEIGELQNLYSPGASEPLIAPDLAASGMQFFAHVRGHLKLSGMEWSNTKKSPTEAFMFDFPSGKQIGRKIQDPPHIRRRVLCVRGQ
jgi:hypothetical protein